VFRRALLIAAAAAGLYFLFFFQLDGVGLIGPDEPRYAAIGREMARSSDFVTPRLWGEPWFEKPPLVYWMAAAGFRAGLNAELAPRLPVALLSAAFLIFFFWILRREFGARAAFLSTAILATSAGWLAFSHAAVTDLPLAATFSASMLLCLPWIERGDRRGLAPAAALLGAATLAKGLVPLVLAAPLFWFGRKRLLDLIRPAPFAAFALVALPWYALVTARNGSAFLDDFFLKHHFQRFASGALQHVQPFWFYLPVLLIGLFPWTPLLAVLFKRGEWKDPRRRFLSVLVLSGFVFFSAAENKLPGYLLPLVPALAALLGASLDSSRRAPAALASSAALLVFIPAGAPILPEAMLRGLTHATPVSSFPWGPAILAGALSAAVFTLARSGKRTAAAAALAAGVLASIVWLEISIFPALDRAASARALWRDAAHRREAVCVGSINRSWRYNLNYYSGAPLPDCAQPSALPRIEQKPGLPPYLLDSSAFGAF
jgi:4-amino-4-deoxy-L-arabinose transferase-like glycosyltransferase